MITRDDLFTVFRTTDPLFATLTDGFVAEWSEGPTTANEEGVPHYILAGAIAEAIVKGLAERNDDFCERSFAMIERLHVEGDAYVREIATIGLLEAIQGYMKAEKLKSDSAVHRLGPESRVWWEKLIQFWEQGDASALRYD